MPEYQYLTEDELLQLANERDQLTDDARHALEAELNLRKLSPAAVASHRTEFEAAEAADKLRQARVKWSISHGIGQRFLGRANYRLDRTGLFETYESTLWFVVLWLPVFPITSCIVRRELSRWLGIVFRSAPVPIERHSRNWEQIFLTWIKTMFVLWAVVLLLSHPEWLKYVLKKIPHTS